MKGKFHVRGNADGTVLHLPTPLSFRGGVEAETGRIIDHSQPRFGSEIKGRILVMPSGRGSSSSSSVRAETIRNGTGPVAIIMQRPDPIITAGAMVARSLYAITCLVVVCAIDGIKDGATIRITVDGGEALMEIS